jgi:hypothetical protein
MSEERQPLSVQEAMDLLVDDDSVHVFSNPAPNVLIGSDWDRKHVIDYFRSAEYLELAGEFAAGMNHAVFASKNSDRFFFATKPEVLSI